MYTVQDTKEPACLRLFLDYQGLPLLWSWMVDVSPNAIDFKTQVLNYVCLFYVRAFGNVSACYPLLIFGLFIMYSISIV